jgi:cell division protein FtsW
MALPASRIHWWHTVWRQLPPVLVGMLAAFLCLLGMLMLFSIGRGGTGAAAVAFHKQLLWLALAAPVFALAALPDPDRLRRLAWLIGAVSLVLLVAVLIPGVGHKVNGARRWLQLGLFNMQVSDFARIGFVIFFAHLLVWVRRRGGAFWLGYVAPMAVLAVVFGLIILQPDFGTAFLFAAVGGSMYFLGGARLWQLLPTAVLGLSGFAALIMIDPVRLRRITAFLDIEGNRAEGAYQLWQGILGFGAGGMQGVGLGNGRQQLAFLPEAHTDFIFPIIGEELGLFATGGVLLVFAVLFGLGWWQLRRAPDLFQFLLGAGALLFIVFQALINMGVATGCLPTKGMSLPFISYGGSNLVSSAILLGLFVGGCRRWNQPPRWRARDLRE